LTTTFFLVRHASHPLLGRVLVGRMPNVSLGMDGRAQTQELARRFGHQPIASVYSSPQLRARETAEPIAESVGTPTIATPALDEVDAGEWTGMSFDDLRPDPRWQHWNRARESARTPGGESMRDVQARVVHHLRKLQGAAPDTHIVLVSHADVIKAALLFYLKLPLWGLDSLDIAPASLSTIAVGDWGAKVLALNTVVS
jgi:broad specificity phosphatase PhoE